MSLTKEQARRTAQILYPDLWSSNPVEAIAKAIEFVHEAAFEVATPNNDSPHALDNAPKTAPIIDALRQHMKRAHVHVNVTARAIGVSAYTVRTWLEGKYAPNETNAKKIAEFLEGLNATPEILKGD